MKFGPGWLHPFETSSFWLRFELGGNWSNMDQPVTRFTQAYDRARVIADHVFRSSERLIGVVMCFDESSTLGGGRREHGMASLRGLGFRTSDPLESWEGLPPWLKDEPEEDLPPCRWAAFDLTADLTQRDILLWCSVSDEMPISPNAAVVSYIVDPDAELVLHVYDDRGMDLTGLTRDGVGEAYEAFSDWLLDYDRERMASAFDI